MDTYNDNSIATLVEMGYDADIIACAMEESTNKSLEEVLDLLLFRTEHYRKLLKRKHEEGIQPKFKKKYSLVEDQPKHTHIPSQPKKKQVVAFSDSDDDWIDENIIDDNKKPIEVTQIGFGQKAKSVMVGKPKPDPSKDNKENLQNQLPEGVLSKYMDADGSKHVESMTSSLAQVISKNPNDYINKVFENFDTIKNDTSRANRILQKYLSAEQGHFPQVVDLKNIVFAVLSKILTMKLKKNVNVQAKKLEDAILTAFEMRLMSSKQMDSVRDYYDKFCDKLSLPIDEILEEKLAKYYADTVNNRPPSWSVALQEEDVNKIKVEEPPKMVMDDSRNVEEVKVSDIVTFIEHKSAVAVDDCIVCMEKTREIVFLPCCHFLTCPLCSPRISKCPMCNKRIDKHLKISWS